MIKLQKRFAYTGFLTVLTFMMIIFGWNLKKCQILNCQEFNNFWILLHDINLCCKILLVFIKLYHKISKIYLIAKFFASVWLLFHFNMFCPGNLILEKWIPLNVSKNLPKYVCQNVFYLVTVELGLAELDILAQCFSMSDQSNAYFSGLKHYPSHNWPFKINPCHIP